MYTGGRPHWRFERALCAACLAVVVASSAPGIVRAQTTPFPSPAERSEPISYTRTENLALGVHLVEDPADRRAVRGLVETNVLGFDVLARHALFADLEAEGESGAADPIANRSELRADRAVQGYPLAPLSLGLGLTHDIHESGTSLVKGTGRVATSVFDRPVAHTIRWTAARDGDVADDHTVDGALLASERIGPVLFRGSAAYDAMPHAELRSIGLTADVPVHSGATARFGITHSQVPEISQIYSLGFNASFTRVNWGAALRYVDDGEYRVLMGVSIGLNRGPNSIRRGFAVPAAADDGTVSARVFLDRDGDGRFAAGDQPLADVVVEARGTSKACRTDVAGRALLTGLPANRPVRIWLARRNLESRQMVPVREAIEVTTRPAATATVEFPVVRLAATGGASR